MDKEMKVRCAWERAKLTGAMFFAMAAGAAAHHQYIVLSQAEGPVPARVVTIYQMEAKPAPELVSAPLRQQEVEESMEWTAEDPEGEARMDDLELLAVCVEAEAGNQGLTGKRMVVDVVLNRVDDPDFPDTIEGVISDRNAFASYWNGGMDRVMDLSEETILAVQMETERRGWPGLLYFTAGDWPEYGTPWRRVGDHYFSTK